MRREIEPTIPGQNIHEAGRGREWGAEPLGQVPMALPASNNVTQGARGGNAVAARGGNGGQAAAARVHRVPRQTQNKPAKAG